MTDLRCVSRTNIALLVLLALVIQNTSLVILLKWTFREGAKQYDPTTVVFTVEFVKVMVCSLVVSSQSVEQFVAAMLQIPRQKLLIFPSFLYVIQNNLLFFGARRLTPIAYIVCSQMKLLTSAIMSRIFLGTRLSTVQLLALVALTVGIVTVESRSDTESSPSSSTPSGDSFMGAAAVLLASFTSGLAGVLLEKLFKSHGTAAVARLESSVWIRNVQLGIVSLPFAFAGTRMRRDGGDFFQGYDVVLVCVVLVQAIGGILTGYVLKYADNIMKCLAISISICCCATYSVARGEQNVSVPLVLGVAVVIAAVSVFSLNPRKPSPSATAIEHKVVARAVV